MKYVGSKNRISKQIAPIIQSYIDGMGDKCNGYWEPFVGGAKMIYLTQSQKPNTMLLIKTHLVIQSGMLVL